MEEYIEPTYIVYVKLNENNLITEVNSSAFLSDADGWTEIDSGHTQRHHHAQGNYFDKPIYDDRGIKRYRAYPFADAPAGEIIARFFKDGVEYLILERTQEEMDADYAALPPAPPSDKERIAALEAQIAAYEAAFEEGVSEGWA